MGEVIDNRKESVLEKLKKLKKYEAKKLRFATGFLFFNGWKDLEKTIPDNIEKFKLLFGFTDREMAILLSETITEDDISYVLSNIARALNDDILEELKNDKKFIELVEKGVLEVRWYDKLHAKLYLYTNQEKGDEFTDGRAIVGSSNITSRGLTEPGELNFWVDSGSDIVKLIDWFESQWENGKELDPDILLHAIVNESARRKAVKSNEFIDPEDLGWNLTQSYMFLFWHILGGVYDINEVIEMVSKPTRQKPLIQPHNEEAIIWGYQIIDKYGGVILADPVGMGKSFQALGIIAYLRSRKDIRKVLLIAPPHLIKGTKDEHGHWERYIRNFFRNVKEVGKVDNITQSRVFECEDEKGKFELALVSSYGLSLLDEEGPVVKDLADYDMVVVDEAHHFKNVDAKKRRVLNKIVNTHRERTGANPYTVLLTATPIINDVAEILALMSIYTQGDTGDFDVLARVELDRDIIRSFERYQEAVNKLKDSSLDKKDRDKYQKQKKDALETITSFLKEAIVLRSRAYVEKKYWGGSGPRPKLKNTTYSYTPKEQELVDLINELTLKYLDLSPSTLLFIKKIAVRSGKKKLDIQREMITLQGIMKILLAKRLESSACAFFSTLKKMRETMEFVLDLLKSESDAHKIATRIYARKIGKLNGEESGEEDEESRLAGAGIYTLDESDEKYIKALEDHVRKIVVDPKKLQEIIAGIEEDIKKIDGILSGGDVKKIAREYSSKEKKLVEYLHNMKNQNKKVILYSMYVDTVECLENYLKDNGFSDDEIVVVTGKTKFKSAKIEKMREKKGFAVMLSTDALSEGVNLEFVDELINYDIPWTPSTIMQRVGRLWRANRQKEIIFYTVLPPPELQNAFSTVVEKVEEKLKKIRDLLIQEIRLLKEEEELTENFEEKVYGNVYSDDEESRRYLRELGNREQEGLKNLILELINSEEYEGRPLKEWIKEYEEEFKNVEKEIEKGKVLNMATEDIPIALIRFGKKWWQKIRGNMEIYDEKKMGEKLKEKWYEAKSKKKPIKWNIRGRRFKVAEIVNGFKNKLKTHITEIIKKRGGKEWEILNALSQTTIGTHYDEELKRLKDDVFLILAYYFYNRKMSIHRRRALHILEDLGFINSNKTPNIPKFNDKNALKELYKKLKTEVEDVKVEVLI